MNTVYQTTTKNFDLIKIVETEDNYFLTYFNDTFVSQDLSFTQALNEVERQLSL